MDDAPRTYTVSELAGAVRGTLERELGRVHVRGELSNFKQAPSRHLYFTLKDDRAQLRGVMFRGDALGLRFLPANGVEVDVTGDLTVYEARGDLQIIVRRMEPSGLGALMRAFEELKRSLAAEGLFAQERKRPLPAFPNRVAVVTSPTGAAIRDLLHVLRRRWPPAEIVVVPVQVQGEAAAPDIVRALGRIGAGDGIDVVIVGRGGGSVEDLWAFNEESVARAIAACPVPVVSAVGHETDVTIADFVADLRAATPSAAAELVVPDIRDVRARIAGAGERMTVSLGRTLDGHRRHLNGLVRGYGLRRPEEFLRRDRRRLDHLVFRLGRGGDDRLERARSRLALGAADLGRHRPRARVAAARTRVTQEARALDRAFAEGVRTLGHRVRGAERALGALDPRAVLDRGYCLVRRGETGPTVGRASDLKPEETIVLQFRKDRARTRVVESGPGGLPELEPPKETV